MHDELEHFDYTAASIRTCRNHGLSRSSCLRSFLLKLEAINPEIEKCCSH